MSSAVKRQGKITLCRQTYRRAVHLAITCAFISDAAGVTYRAGTKPPSFYLALFRRSVLRSSCFSVSESRSTLTDKVFSMVTIPMAHHSENWTTGLGLSSVEDAQSPGTKPILNQTSNQPLIHVSHSCLVVMKMFYLWMTRKTTFLLSMYKWWPRGRRDGSVVGST